MFEYINKGKRHIDTTRGYMLSIGMSADAIDSVLLQKEFEEKQILQLRAKAYREEADPMYIEWQYELETTPVDAETYKQAWLNKKTEIKLRHPIPSAA